VTLADATQADKSFADTTFNGDGVIIEASAPDEPTRHAIRDIAECMGTVPDRSGKPGIDQLKSDGFFAACVAFDAWHRAAEADRAQVLPLGDATAAASGAVRNVRVRAEDYFRRCRLAAFDPRALPLLERKEDESLTAVGTDGNGRAGGDGGAPARPAGARQGVAARVGLEPRARGRGGGVACRRGAAAARRASGALGTGRGASWCSGSRRSRPGTRPQRGPPWSDWGSRACASCSRAAPARRSRR
jgi:hypothetical protein